MPKVTVQTILAKKAAGQKITMLTAHDFPTARMVDEAGVDMVLVGDSLAMVVQGHENTIPVTMDQMVYHAIMAKRGIKNALLVGDMPFLSYQAGPEQAVLNAGRFLKEAGCEAVKLEGGVNIAGQIKALVTADIPVIAHLGLTPQSVHRMGGYKVQGREERAAARLIEEARAVEEAGAFAVVLEAVPMELAKKITGTLSIPTIGIGAGPHCDGQVLVLYDVIGMFERFLPKFAKRYANLKEEALKAVLAYKDEVEKGVFPSEEQSFR
ncbi:MAG: 3-methyl-2-oxobutanoate hydroxymethyltransferase [Actinomycetota bacterium]|nr:3-methyl-2-oxobutanoate hydroxymethyltransferase [Actinomycetota bacterium]